jgi:hypothetical protein
MQMIMSSSGIHTRTERIQAIREADRIHRFPAKMSPSVAFSFIARYREENHRRKIRFHDPLCGSGTTLLVARSLGLTVSGADALYPAVTISRAKLIRLTPEKLWEMREFGQQLTVSSSSIPKCVWPNSSLWFSERTLRRLQELAESIVEIQKEPFFPHVLTAFFQTIWDVSSADKSVIVPTRSDYSRKTRRVRPERVLPIFHERLDRIDTAQQALRTLSIDPGSCHVTHSDALDRRTWPDHQLDLILTSPPYGCGIDYERAFRLQMRVWAPFMKRKPRDFELIGRQRPLKEDNGLPGYGYWKFIRRKAVANGSHERWQMFFQYLEDIVRLLRVSRSKLSRKGRLCIVIGNPQINKIRVPLLHILERLASNEGFKLEATPASDRIRTRLQNLRLRSATGPIRREYLVSLLPN